jgi:hypothetical protein
MSQMHFFIIKVIELNHVILGLRVEFTSESEDD